jgi:hypothetical protein
VAAEVLGEELDDSTPHRAVARPTMPGWSPRCTWPTHSRLGIETTAPLRCVPHALRQVHNGTGEGPGDAVHRLHARHHQLAQLVDVAGLGADDHVIGLVTAWACSTPVMSTMSLATWAALPTSVWMRMYAVTTGPDLLASCRPRRPGESGAEAMVACDGRVGRLRGRQDGVDRRFARRGAAGCRDWRSPHSEYRRCQLAFVRLTTVRTTGPRPARPLAARSGSASGATCRLDAPGRR